VPANAPKPKHPTNAAACTLSVTNVVSAPNKPYDAHNHQYGGNYEKTFKLT